MALIVSFVFITCDLFDTSTPTGLFSVDLTRNMHGFGPTNNNLDSNIGTFGRGLTEDEVIEFVLSLGGLQFDGKAFPGAFNGHSMHWNGLYHTEHELREWCKNARNEKNLSPSEKNLSPKIVYYNTHWVPQSGNILQLESISEFALIYRPEYEFWPRIWNINPDSKPIPGPNG
jgi:hypothetical protein